jgi:riboflavin-specific deaminase-like protein
MTDVAMRSQTGGAATSSSDWSPGARDAWQIVVAAARAAERASGMEGDVAFGPACESELQPVATDAPEAVLIWIHGRGWVSVLPPEDPRSSFIDLYLPVCSATPSHPITLGHLGQSLDGFIATHTGESQFVTGAENIRHLHRLRALCDAVVVGAGTVAADDPQLTTRHVPGPSPLRVVIDPDRRLGEHYRVFSDDAAATLYVCARSAARPDEGYFGRATLVGVDATGDGVDLPALVRLLRRRGCARIFVEGGGVTVSMFLEARLLDRLHVTIAPLIIGDGRPAIRLPPPASLSDCPRPHYRVFRMGGDVLFDCTLDSSNATAAADRETDPSVVRVI